MEARLTFSWQEIENLLLTPPKAKDRDKGIVFDRSLWDAVQDKSEIIKSLKEDIKHIAEEEHMVDKIEQYKAACENIENFDLSI